MTKPSGPPPATAESTPTIHFVFSLTWPMALKAIMLHGIVVIDALLVAQLGEEILAAMGLAASMAGLLLGVLFAFSTAMQIRVAQAFGSGEVVSLKSAFWCGMAVNLVVAALGLALLGAFGPRIVAAFAHSPVIAGEALNYLAVFAVVIVAESVAPCISSHFNSSGRPACRSIATSSPCPSISASASF